MRLKSLYVRNSIGIYDGLGLYEVKILFDRFDEGLIGVVGPNGSGKTTLIENMTPYRTMISRTGNLYDEYFTVFKCNHCDYTVHNGKLKQCPKCRYKVYKILDGIRELEFVIGDHTYRSVININSDARTMSAYLYKDGKEKAENDKLDEYDLLIEELFGPFEIFRKSIFSGQNEEGLSELKKGALKKFCSQLLDVDKYEKVFRPLNKQKINDVESQIGNDRIRIEEANKSVEKEELVQRELKEVNTLLEQIRYTITEHDKEIEKYMDELRTVEKAVSASINAQSELKRIQTDGEKLNKNIEDAKKSASEATERKDNRIKELCEKIDKIRSTTIPQFEQNLKEKEKLLKNKNLIEENYQKLKNATDEITQAFSIKQEYDDIEKQISEQQHLLEKDRDQLKHKINLLKSELDSMVSEEQLSKEVPCNNTLYKKCSIFSKTTDTEKIKELELEIKKLGETTFPEKEEKLKELQNKLNSIELIDISELESQKNKLTEEKWDEYYSQLQIAEQQIESLETSIESEHQRINDFDEEIEKNKEEKKQTAIELTNRIKELEDRISALRQEYKEKEKLIDDDLVHQSENIRIAMDSVTKKREELIHQKGQKQANISEYKRILEVVNLDKERLEGLNKSLGDKLNEIEERNIIDQFLKELPVWELENLSPIITVNANDLLAEFYDSSWTIRIDTLSLKARSDEYKEDFKITVYKDGVPREFNKLSGGQKIMVESTLRQAIKLVGKELNDRNIQTAFCDESDGAFDSDNADTYYKMLEHVHNAGEMFHTFIITHRQELVSRLDQTITLGDGKVLIT
jgi:exonuclease SbcC